MTAPREAPKVLSERQCDELRRLAGWWSLTVDDHMIRMDREILGTIEAQRSLLGEAEDDRAKLRARLAEVEQKRDAIGAGARECVAARRSLEAQRDGIRAERDRLRRVVLRLEVFLDEYDEDEWMDDEFIEHVRRELEALDAHREQGPETDGGGE